MDNVRYGSLADIRSRRAMVRFVPEADIARGNRLPTLTCCKNKKGPLDPARERPHAKAAAPGAAALPANHQGRARMHRYGGAGQNFK